MHSLFVLSTAFALLVTYLEFTGQPRQTAIQPLLTAKVIRTPSIAQKNDTNKSETPYAGIETDPTPLDLRLNLPMLDNIQQHYNDGKSSVLNLFKHNAKQAITYNAELVFDAEKGESITGGKINIKIPLG